MTGNPYREYQGKESSLQVRGCLLIFQLKKYDKSVIVPVSHMKRASIITRKGVEMLEIHCSNGYWVTIPEISLAEFCDAYLEAISWKKEKE